MSMEVPLEKHPGWEVLYREEKARADALEDQIRMLNIEVKWNTAMAKDASTDLNAMLQECRAENVRLKQQLGIKV